jgi:hypothetical protein
VFVAQAHAPHASPPVTYIYRCVTSTNVYGQAYSKPVPSAAPVLGAVGGGLLQHLLRTPGVCYTHHPGVEEPVWHA